MHLCSFARCTLDMDDPMLGFDQGFGDRESQTIGATVIGRVGADLVETVEQVG